MFNLFKKQPEKLKPLITARELGKRLVKLGNVPVMLTLDVEGENSYATLMERGVLHVSAHDSAGGKYGATSVARILLEYKDNA